MSAGMILEDFIAYLWRHRREFSMRWVERYIKLSRPGTNPRSPEFTKEALSNLVNDRMSEAIEIY